MPVELLVSIGVLAIVMVLCCVLLVALELRQASNVRNDAERIKRNVK